MIPVRFRRGSALLMMFAALTAISCSSDTTNPPDPDPTISIALASATLDITQGGTVIVPVNLTRSEFTGPVTLTAEGLPAGVTTAGGSVASGNTGSLTLAAAAAATPGTSTITIRATGSGVTAATATLSLTVRVRGTFSLAGSPATVAVVQGGTATTSIALTRLDSFSGDVALTAAAPAGITATIAPATLPPGGATSATLNISVAGTVAPGSYTVTVSGASAGLTAVTTPITVTVTAPGSFTMAATPPTLNLAPGATGTSTINVTRANGFTGAVALTSAQPGGLTVSFNPNPPITGTSTVVTVTVGAATAPGSYTITLTGTATGIPAQTATITVTVPAVTGFTMAVSPTTLSQQQGTNGTAVVTLTRTGGFTGAIALTADVPAGLTVAFAPASVTDASSVATVSASAAIPAGNYTVTIRANAAGQPERLATIAVTVTAAPGGFSIVAAPAAITIAAGSNGNTNINITRTGAFTGTVNLTATTPAGVTATFVPSAVTAGTSVLTLAVAPGTAAGPLTVTVRGNATGMTEQTTTIALTVTAAGGGGGNVAWQFCGLSGIPVAVFAQDNGADWFPVTGTAGNVYSFQINGGRGGIAYVYAANGGGFRTRIVHGTTAELITQGTSLCFGATGNKTVTATTSGLGAFDVSYNTLGQSLGVTAGTNVTFNNVLDGPLDLIASKTTIGGAGLTPTGFLIQRNLNIANGGSAGALNFGSAFAPASATLTVNGLNGETLINGATYRTPRNTAGVLYAGFSGNTWYGIPAAQQQAGESHMVFAIAVQNQLDQYTPTRQVLFISNAVAAKTVTLGAALNVPTVTTVATTPYVRMRTVVTVQPDYNKYFTADWQQGTGTTYRDFVMEMSSSYNNNAATATFEIPNFAGLTGWLNDYALKTGTPSTWVVTASGFTGAGINGPDLTDGAVIFSGTRQGPITP